MIQKQIIPICERVQIPSVGLMIMTRVSKRSPVVVVMRRRNKQKFNGGLLVEPWAGALVATVHGKKKWKESSNQTLWRKAKEQLGDGFLNATRLEDRDIHLLYEENQKLVKTYGLCVRFSSVELIRFDTSTAGIELIPLSEIENIRSLTQSDRERPINNFNDYAMFEDEKNALIIARENKQLLSFLGRYK